MSAADANRAGAGDAGVDAGKNGGKDGGKDGATGGAGGFRAVPGKKRSIDDGPDRSAGPSGDGSGTGALRRTRTPLSEVKGLGSAKEGTSHFWTQRLTAIALVPLMIWLAFSIASLPGRDYLSIRDWLAGPFNAVAMILVIVTGFFHARLGLHEIAIDYVHGTAARTVTMIAINFAAVALAVAGVFAVLRIAFGA